MKTEFTDRHGKALYVGDIVRYYLSDIGSGGPVLLRIVRNKKGVVKVCHPRDTNKSGWVLRQTHANNMTLFDTSEREED